MTDQKPAADVREIPPTAPLPSKARMEAIKAKLEAGVGTLTPLQPLAETTVQAGPAPEILQIQATQPSEGLRAQAPQAPTGQFNPSKFLQENPEYAWTTAQEADLIQAYRSSHSFEQVAEKVGRQKYLVREKLVAMFMEKKQYAEMRSVLLR